MSGTEKNILLVEDEPFAQTLYQNRLQREGFKISFAEDGELAINALAKAPPDLVVLDLMLPKINGTEVLKHIRAQDRLKTTPVLVISNAYMSELSQRALESGATRGMLKTECTPARLVETVRDMLGYRSPFDLADKPLSDKRQMEEFTAAAEAALADEMELKGTREEFFQKAPAEVSKIREHCLAYIKTATTPASLDPLNHLYKHVRFLATRAGLSGCTRLALVANAFEALLFETLFKPAKSSPSVPQTFAQAVDCLERLCQDKGGALNESIPKARILVVDDDAVCNFAMVAALKRAHFDPVSIEDPQKAIELARSNRYDVVFLDINMPTINGFEVCKNLRTLPEYKETPVIFITSNSDFQNRAQSILSGGNDLIPKPVSPVELVLKTTMRLLQPHGHSPEKAVATKKPANGAPEIAALPFTVPSETEIVRKGANGAFLPVEALKMGKVETEEEILEKLSPPPGGVKIKLPETKHETPKTELPKPESAAPKASAAPTVPPEIAKLIDESRVEAAKALEPPKLKMVADDEITKAPSGDAKEATPKAEASAVKVIETPPPIPVENAKPIEPEKKTDAPKPTEPPILKMAADANAELPKAPSAEVKEALPKVEAPAPRPVEVAPPAPVESAKPAEPEKLAIVTDVKPAAPAETKVELPKPEAPKPIQNEKPAETKLPEPEKKAEVAQPKAMETFVPNTNKNTNTSSTTKPTMETKPKTTFDEAARGVARIIFGDENISEMNVRLTRIALERYNVPGTQNLDEIARGVTKIIFGDEGVSEMNVRLTRIALQSYNIMEVLGHTNGAENKVVAL